MAKIMNTIQLLEYFISEPDEVPTDQRPHGANTHLIGNQLLHYDTPIVEKAKDGYILNLSRYSEVTGLLQKRIKAYFVEHSVPYKTVLKVERDYKGSLKDYLK